jgi:tyrosyl-tRNA synthetase
VFEAHKARALQLEGGTEEKGLKTDKSLIFLGSEEITAFLKYKGLVSERLAHDNLSFKVISGKEGEGAEVSRSSKVDKIFRVEFESDLPPQEFKQDMVEAFRKKFRFRVEETILEEFSKRYQAVYEKYLFNGKVYDQINLREEGVS